MSTLIEAQATVVQRQRPQTLELPADASGRVGPRVASTARGGRRRRAAGAAALAAGVFATAVLLSRPLEVQTTPAAPLPPMPASLGFWDRLQPPPALPEMPNDLGFWDRLR